jgi:hydroxymethylbilane synthase
MTSHIRLATRASPLALWQARHAASLLRRAWPGLRVDLVPVTSGGDLDLVTPLYRLGAVGVFCKEVHALVLSGRADAGVHSCKDLPTASPDGLAIRAILRRADPRDALIGAASIADLPAGAVIGTSSLRRQAQLAALRPDLRFVAIRGNVQTRLRKVADGEAAATVMAMAGLSRLGLAIQARAEPLDPWTVMTPAPAQGAIAIDALADDRRMERLLAPLHHRDTATAIGIERDLLARLAGGCSLPLGAHAVRGQRGWRLRARLGRDDRMIEGDWTGAAADLARQAATALAG